MADRPLILISNDDGIHATGIAALAGGLEDLGEILVVAPAREQSAMSHAISLDRPLRKTEVRKGWFAIDGTPVDCVYLGLLNIAPRPPALVISGINHGYNLGADVFYSGTVAAAVEGAIRGVPSFAISQSAHEPDFGGAARFAHALAHTVLAMGLPPQTLLNVNIPPGKLGGYRWTRLGRRIYRDQVEERADLRGRHYYWIGGPDAGFSDVPGSDCHAMRDGVASVTPLDLDLTHAHLLEQLPGWELRGFEAVLEHEAQAGAASAGRRPPSAG
jgi:5'-nucleotidase